MVSEPSLTIDSSFLPDHEAVFQQLLDTIDWDESMAARKTASFGQPYDYSQMNYAVTEMHPMLAPIADLLEERIGFRPNNCLLNYYEGGDNTMGYHSDETEILEPETGVAIVSVGSARDITFREKANTDNKPTYTLGPGSLLYMEQQVQHDWMHAIKKQRGAGPRISMTWRAIKKQLTE